MNKRYIFDYYTLLIHLLFLFEILGIIFNIGGVRGWWIIEGVFVFILFISVYSKNGFKKLWYKEAKNGTA